MTHRWHRHPFRLLLYLEWILLGITLLATIGGLFPHRPRHHWVAVPVWTSLLGVGCVVLLGVMGWRLPQNSKLLAQIYTAAGFGLSLAIALLNRGGENLLGILLLVVSIRASLLFAWRGRILVAVLAYVAFLTVQILSWLKISLFGIPWGRPLPPLFRRLPPEELNRVLFRLVFNSGLFFAFVLAFVLLLVGAIIAEHDSRTKLMQAHRRLREYALQIENQATLQERNRIAREIHDSVGHYLTAQSIQLENTEVFLTQDSAKAAQHLSKARKLGKDALANIRASVATLRTDPFQERSLLSLIEQSLADFQAHTNVAIVHRIELTSPITNKVKVSLFRIVQEALTNITKHSQATQVWLSLEATQNTIHLAIRDNGCGFNPQANTTGFGLQGMQERTAALQGKITIDSQLGQGCLIQVAIPIT